MKACAFSSFLCNVHHNVDHSRLGFVELGHVATCSYEGSAQKHLIGLEYYSGTSEQGTIVLSLVERLSLSRR